MPVVDVTPQRRVHKKKADGIISVDVGSDTKHRLNEIARQGDTSVPAILEGLIHKFLDMKPEQQKEFLPGKGCIGPL